MRGWIQLLATVSVVIGCGGEKDKGQFVSKPGNTSADSGSPSTPSDGGSPLPSPDAGMIDPLAPVVTIMEPVAAADPNQDTVVTSDEVVARCRVEKSPLRTAREVDPSSVTIEVLWVDPDSTPKSVAAAVNALADSEFEGRFNLGDLPNGPVRFRCTAKDVGGTNASMGTASVDTFLDLGPEIQILDPKEESTHALRSPVSIKFRARPAPLNDADQEAGMVGLALTVTQREFSITESPDDPGLYTASVDFDDRTVFEMPPSTAQISVTASSSRSPEAAQRSRRVNIKLDSDGPKITFQSPSHLQIVRGDVLLTVNITDESGVDASSVVATINRTLFELSDWKVSGSTYSQRFDTRSFPKTLNQLTINLRASDNVGNKTTAELGLRLDNVPPILSLDPPKIREYTQTNNQRTCSAAFDPLGKAVSDLEASPDNTLFRVMVWDRTNRADGDQFGYLATVDPASVVLYAQQPHIPLLIDSDGDSENLCDEIHTEHADPDDIPQQINLSEVAVRGAAFYPTEGLSDFEMSPVAPSWCGFGTQVAPPPGNTLCEIADGDMTRAVNQYIEGVYAAVYARAPTNGTTGECAGTVWNLGDHYPDGWLCIAARAEDKIGNVGVSRPIRVCYGSDCDPSEAPSCLSGCEAPVEFRDLEGTIVVPNR